MEAGFGWDYPPGTPGVRERSVDVECRGCGRAFGAVAHEELGASELVPGECPDCGGDDLEVV